MTELNAQYGLGFRRLLAMADFSDETKLALQLQKKDLRRKHDVELDMERDTTEEARSYMREAVSALQEIYAIRGEERDVAVICNRVLSQSWASSE